ncbi:MAG: septum formation protein Maf [Clostridia bacterium]|nr:septum formation protein Maf [Clostridia bacterium]
MTINVNINEEDQKTLLILASGSPRRAEMMARITPFFQIVEPQVDESSLAGETPADMAKRLALKKATAVYEATKGRLPVVAADTIVVHGSIMGKPDCKEEASRMLRELSGARHLVITGVAIINPKNQTTVCFSETTEVVFGVIDEKDIEEYVNSGDPMDKAGAYGIQGAGGKFIERVNGCFYNVMGFPLYRIYKNLKDMGIV